jgi:NADH-quinone oxidoreductase subunit D
MEWIDVPFGPFFPGIAGGLLLTLTLDGDTVAGSSVDTLVGKKALMLQSEMSCVDFIERLSSLEPLTPICYQVLVCQAIENAARKKVEPLIAKARLVAMEQERIISHLGWLILFAKQTGFDWLLKRATTLQRDFIHAGFKEIIALKPSVLGLKKRLLRTPLLNSRTRNIGLLNSKHAELLLGPVARASGIKNDARCNSAIYTELGFKPIIIPEGDVRARLQLRVNEISQSLALIESMGFTGNSVINVYTLKGINDVSGQGEAELETPRGRAKLEVSLEQGQVVAAQMQTPSTQHATHTQHTSPSPINTT